MAAIYSNLVGSLSNTDVDDGTYYSSHTLTSFARGDRTLFFSWSCSAEHGDEISGRDISRVSPPVQPYTNTLPYTNILPYTDTQPYTNTQPYTYTNPLTITPEASMSHTLYRSTEMTPDAGIGRVIYHHAAVFLLFSLVAPHPHRFPPVSTAVGTNSSTTRCI